MTATWILAGLSVACWLLFLYPYLIYPQILRLLSKQAIRQSPVQLPVSLLFCAYNEIECLPEKLENLRRVKRASPGLQILAYDDASTDGTQQLLATASDLLTLVRGPGRTGKAAGMKQLVRHATGKLLLFTDANILLSEDVVDRLLPYYGDPQIGGVCCTIMTPEYRRSVTGEVGSTYLALDDRLQQLESLTGNVMGASGGLFSVRRELYPEFPDTVQDDLTVSMNVIFQGKRLIKATDVIAYENTVDSRDEEFRRKVRIGARAFHTHNILKSQIARMSARDRFKYVSRKMLRWFGGVFVAMGTIFALAAIATVSPLLAMGATGAALVAMFVSIRSRDGYPAKIAEAGLAIFGTLLGVLKAMSGRTVATWAPAKSR